MLQATAHLVRDPLLPDEIMPLEGRRRLLDATSDYQGQAQELWVRWLSEW